MQTPLLPSPPRSPGCLASMAIAFFLTLIRPCHCFGFGPEELERGFRSHHLGPYITPLTDAAGVNVRQCTPYRILQHGE